MKIFNASFILFLMGLMVTAVRSQEAPGGLEKDAAEVLRRNVAEREKRVVEGVFTNNISLGRQLTFSEMEKLFLEGAVTARQFQFYIEHAHRNRVSLKPASKEEVHVQAIQVLRKSTPDPMLNPKPGPAIQAEQIPLLNPLEPQVEDPLEKGISEIEAKMDELLRRKQQRDKSTNEVGLAAGDDNTNVAKTKRQRLDDLLRLYIAGKLGETEYKERRERIIAEPE